MSPSFPGQMGGLAATYAIVTTLLTIALHVVFALAVYSDAEAQRRDGRPPQLVGPVWWAIGTFLGGIMIAAVYWVMHHSTLRPGVGVKPAALEPAELP